MTKIKEKIYEHDFVYSHILDNIKNGQVQITKFLLTDLLMW